MRDTIRRWYDDESDEVLRAKARAIPELDFNTDGLYAFADTLVTTMIAANGAGLAAPQLSLANFHRAAFAVRINADEGAVLFNPEIVATSTEIVRGPEACLSLASVSVEVAAPKWIDLRFRAIDGSSHAQRFEDELARVVAHEVRHLEGKLIVDYLDPGALSRRLFRRDVVKARRARKAAQKALRGRA